MSVLIQLEAVAENGMTVWSSCFNRVISLAPDGSVDFYVEEIRAAMRVENVVGVLELVRNDDMHGVSFLVSPCMTYGWVRRDRKTGETSIVGDTSLFEAA